jgi:chromosome segregation ATPase
MSAELAHKENNYEMPMVPFFSLDMARELGDLAAGQRQLESGQARLEVRIDALEAKMDAKFDTLEAKMDAKFDALEAKMDAKIDAIDAKFEAKTDKMAYQLNRLDERTKFMQTQIMVIGGGTLVAVLAGIVLQLFKQ